MIMIIIINDEIKKDGIHETNAIMIQNEWYYWQKV